jgi:hypothetical protein
MTGFGWWACVDLNHGPLPYQIVSPLALICSFPGQWPFWLPVSDRWRLWFSVRSGTHLARRPHGCRPCDLLIRRDLRSRLP